MGEWHHGFGLALIVSALVGCSTADSSSGASSDSGVTTATRATLPACAYDPAVVDAGAGDAGVATTQVTRAYLSCSTGNGASEDCGSDDPTRCPDDGAPAGGADTSCTDLCAATEYAVSYSVAPMFSSDGASNVPTAPTLPASCRMLAAGPGGGITFCCSCAQ